MTSNLRRDHSTACDAIGAAAGRGTPPDRPCARGAPRSVPPTRRPPNTWRRRSRTSSCRSPWKRSSPTRGGVPELLVVLMIGAFWLIPVAAGVWALITLQRIRTAQDDMRR